jgi:TP901 family phage tail tape measure protein
MAASLKTTITADASQHNKSVADAAKSISSYKNEVKNAQSQIKTFEGGLRTASSSISDMMSSFKSGDFAGFVSSAKNAGGALKSMIPVMGSVTGAATGMGAAISTALGPIGLITAAISAFVAVGYSAAKANEEFQQSLREASALTGMTGRSLDILGEQAMDLGMKYGKSGSDIIETMKLIGGQSPELLKSSDALSKVSESAMQLAIAGGISVQDAGKAITTAINQFGLGVTESERVMNALAAGALEGSMEINDLAVALERTGTWASAAGISFEETVAAIELVGMKITDASRLGTGLNSVFSALETQTDNNLKPSVVGLEKALDNLAAKTMTAAEMKKLFGEQGVAAAQQLIAERDALAGLTQAVTDTNEAERQAAIISDSWATIGEQLKSTWNSFMIELGQTAIIEQAVDVIKNIIIAIKDLLELLTKVMRAINNLYNYVKEVLSAIVTIVKNKLADIYNRLVDNKLFNGVKSIWVKIKNAIVTEFNKAINSVIGAYNKMLDKIGVSQFKIDFLQEDVETEVETETATPLKKESTPLPESSTSNDSANKPTGKITAVNVNADGINLDGISFEESMNRGIPMTASKGKGNDTGTITDPQAHMKETLDALLPSVMKDWQETQDATKIAEQNQELAKQKELLGGIGAIGSSLSGVFSAFGNALGESGQKIMEFAGVAIQGVTQIIASIMKLIPAKQGEAMANATAEASKAPWYVAVPAILSIIGTIASIFTSIPSFAGGGILKGATSIGDMNVARFNGGEMFLNTRQQSNLFGILDNPMNYRPAHLDGTIQWKLRGADIYGSYNTYSTKRSKI